MESLKTPAKTCASRAPFTSVYGAQTIGSPEITQTEILMSILSVFTLVCCLAASQRIADLVKASLPPGEVSSWFWAVGIHYAICVGLLLLFDKVAFGAALEGALALTFFVRAFFFMKRL